MLFLPLTQPRNQMLNSHLLRQIMLTRQLRTVRTSPVCPAVMHPCQMVTLRLR